MNVSDVYGWFTHQPPYECSFNYVSERKIRLFACALWREVMGRDYYPDDGSLSRLWEVVEKVERTDGAMPVPCKMPKLSCLSPNWLPYQMTLAKFVVRYSLAYVIRLMAQNASHKVEWDAFDFGGTPDDHVQERDGNLLRAAELAVNTFRTGPTPRVSPEAAALARACYEHRSSDGSFDGDRMAVLADCLYDEGQDELAAAMREPGPHYLGHWSLDVVLGKNSWRPCRSGPTNWRRLATPGRPG